MAASHVRTKNVLKDFWTLLASIFGGESRYYTHLANECTEAAADTMVAQAKKLGANAVVGVRFEVSNTMNRFVLGMHTSVMAYGTAVVVRKHSDTSSR